MIWRWRRRDGTRRARRGQAITEMALMTPFFMLILLGALDLGRIYIDQNRLNSAIKEAAILGLYQPIPATVQARAFQEVTDPATGRKLLGTEGSPPDGEFWVEMTCYKADGTVVDNCADDFIPAPGAYIEVTGYHVFRPITSQILRFLPADGTIKKTVRAVY
ncbi:MAG: TadE family protein [Thermomicrobiales bacterium]